MTHLEFAKKLHEAFPLLSVKDCRKALDAMGDIAAAELLGGGEVPLPKLGKLKVREMAAREGHNPITGEVIAIPAHKKVAFFAGKDLKEAMN